MTVSVAKGARVYIDGLEVGAVQSVEPPARTYVAAVRRKANGRISVIIERPMTCLAALNCGARA